MHGSLEIIQGFTLILLIAGIMGAIFNLIRLPGVLAFILAGILIGPGGLKLVSSTEMISTIAQLGIIFLLFVLGAELSLPRLKEMRIHVLWAGILQVVLTTIFLSVVFFLFGLDIRTSIFLGGALTLSSTAIVLKMMGDQGELESTHGRLIMGILIVQDLALVPLMAFMPLLTGQGGSGNILESLLLVTLKVGLFLGGFFLLSWKFVPWLIDKIAAISSKEVFSVFVVAFGLLVALVAEMLGLSYAVGAFIAGLALSKSVTSRQIIAESLPFRDMFSTVFFVSVGMLMNTEFLINNLTLTIGVMVLIFVVKIVTMALAVFLLRFPLKTVLWCSLSLFQVGEFSFILLQTGTSSGTIDTLTLNTVNSAIVLGMLITPLIMRVIPKLVRQVESRLSRMPRLDKVLVQERTMPLDDEVVIAGYGPIAKNLTQVLQTHEVGFRVIEMNVQTVKKLQEQGIHCVFGDASNIEVLQHAEIQKAKIFAITVPDIRSAELAIQNAKKLNPDIYCIVRSRYQQPIQSLFKLGADEVIYEEFETSMSFIHSILDFFGDHVTDRESYMLLLRENRKALLRAGKSGDDEQSRYGRFSVFKDTKIEWISVPEDSALIGMTLADVGLRQKTGVNVLSIIQPEGEELSNPTPDIQLQASQILVVIGTIEQLTSLEELLC